MKNLKYKVIRLSKAGKFCGVVVSSVSFKYASMICNKFNESYDDKNCTYNVVPQDNIA